MFIHEIRAKLLIDIPGLEGIKDYAIDVNGTVWSCKIRNQWRPVKTRWAKKKGTYQAVDLRDHIYKRKRTLYVHRLVALAFIETSNPNLKIHHKNDIMTDNRVENLEWIIPGQRRKIAKGKIINDGMMKRIRDVHSASIRKGLKLPSTEEFLVTLIEKSIDEHINRYGLKKILEIS